MSHKVHPKAFRIKGIDSWSSRGFYEKRFAKDLEVDVGIREFLQSRIGKLGVEKIDIERFPGRINVIIFTARPGLIIGRGGEGVDRLRKELEKMILKEKLEMKIEIREVKNPWTSAPLVAQWMAAQIEKRIPFRRVLKQSLEKIMANKGVEGARAELSGRLDGNEIARREWLKKGRLPRQTIRADIDYARDAAYCTYGKVGIKIWIYKGEKFE